MITFDEIRVGDDMCFKTDDGGKHYGTVEKVFDIFGVPVVKIHRLSGDPTSVSINLQHVTKFWRV